MNRLTRAQRYEVIWESYQQGSTRSEIARELDCSLRTVDRAIKHEGVFDGANCELGVDKDEWVPLSSYKAPKPWDEIRPGFNKPNRTIYASE